MKNIAIIGSGYGDEGKGLTTDYISYKLLKKYDKGIVIRYNGGAQAGHTVVTSVSRHVFRHFSSGSFLNLPTYLSEYYVSNPILFNNEYDELKNKTNTIQIYINNNSIITTPFDMIFNQTLEKIRGNERHGSVGVGFGESIERNKYIPLIVDNLYPFNITKITKILIEIKKYYINKLSMLNRKISIITDESLIFEFINDLIKFKDLIIPVNINDVRKIIKNNFIIFEGAQGLQLDQDYGLFPYVTRSNTGCKNIINICNNVDIKLNEIIYVNRSYMTRHGNGPLAYEHNNSWSLKEETNLDHEYQGKFRYGLLNLKEINKAINCDIKYLKHDIVINKMITCLDQLPNCFDYITEEGMLLTTYKDKFIAKLNNIFNYFSYGDNRDKILEKENKSNE